MISQPKRWQPWISIRLGQVSSGVCHLGLVGRGAPSFNFVGMVFFRWWKITDSKNQACKGIFWKGRTMVNMSISNSSHKTSLTKPRFWFDFWGFQLRENHRLPHFGLFFFGGEKFHQGKQQMEWVSILAGAVRSCCWAGMPGMEGKWWKMTWGRCFFFEMPLVWWDGHKNRSRIFSTFFSRWCAFLESIRLYFSTNSLCQVVNSVNRLFTLVLTFLGNPYEHGLIRFGPILGPIRFCKIVFSRFS